MERVREVMVRDPASVRRRVSLERWLAASGTRIGALRRLERDTAGELAATASADLDAARASAVRAVVASLAVLILVAGLGLVLRRSITRPLREVSAGARMLSAGQLASGVSYVGRDEIGEVAAAFRDLHVTAERLAEEIRAMNVAVEDNRLDHRADVAAFEGRWAELMGGINDTMAAFAELQGRREQAEAPRRPHLRAVPGSALHRRVRRLLQARQPRVRAPARLPDRDPAVAAHARVRPPRRPRGAATTVT